MHQKSYSNTNIMQNLGDVQSNRNSLSNNAYSMRNNAYQNDSSSNGDSHKFNPFKVVSTNQQQQRTGGIAYDYQVGGKNVSTQNSQNVGVKRNISQETIPPTNKNENINTQNFKQQQSAKQHQVGFTREQQGLNSNNMYHEINENKQQNMQIAENKQGQSQRTSDQKKGSLIHHHGGSKSLDQQAFKRMGSCPNNPVQGLVLNNQLHQSTNQSSSTNIYNKGNINSMQNQNVNQHYKVNSGNSYLTNRLSQNQTNNSSNNNNSQQTVTNSSVCNSQMNVQFYLNQNKPNSQQPSHLFNHPFTTTNNHTRASSNILADYQSVKAFDNKIGLQHFDYVSNQPYMSNQIDHKHLVISQDLDESTEQQLIKLSHPSKHHQLIQQQQQQQQQYDQNDYYQKKQDEIYFMQKQQQQLGYNGQGNSRQNFGNNNIQNQIGLCDMSAINNSINQRDISMIKPSNMQDISCFSRDQSMFLDANRDLSINMRDQSSFLHHNFKKYTNVQATISSGFDLPTPKEQGNFIIQMAEKEEYPTLSNPNFNQDKSLILEGLKDMSINYSKVEEISNILEQEKERNCKLEEKINYQDNILKKMTDFQNDLFTNYEQAQNVIKQLKTESNQDSKLLLKIKSLQDENSILREQIAKGEEVHELKQKDLINQLLKLRNEKDDIQTALLQQNDSLKANMNQFKKYYEEKLMKLQQQIGQLQDKDKNIVEKQGMKIKTDCQDQQTNYKQIVQQLQQVFDIQKENELLPKIKSLGDKDMIKLVDCLTEMMISFAPEGFFEKKPTLKQIWKWLKEVLKEYMKNTSDLKRALVYLNAQKQSEFIEKLEKMVFENESYCKIIQQMKQYFNLDSDIFSNLYELQLFIEKKNSHQLKQRNITSENQPTTTQQEYSYTNITIDSSKI